MTGFDHAPQVDSIYYIPDIFCIIYLIDWGNSPKKRFPKSLNIVFAKGDIEAIMDRVSDDILRNIVGNAALP